MLSRILIGYAVLSAPIVLLGYKALFDSEIQSVLMSLVSAMR